MARIDTLSNLLTDVAAAIKIKKGDATAITPANFDTEIINLPSGGGGEPNIFIQEDEPTTKEGLWIKASDLQVDNIVIDENVFVADTWMDNSLFPKLSHVSSGMSCAVVNGYLYLFGYAVNSNSAKYTYRINLTTYELEPLANAPSYLYGKTALAYGTDVYLIGSINMGVTGGTAFLKYDTLTNTWETLGTLDDKKPTSYNTHYHIYDGYLYMIGTETTDENAVSSTYSGAYRYDIENKTWEAIQLYPYKYTPTRGSSFILGDKIWFIFVYASTTATTITASYCYDTLVYDLSEQTFKTTNLRIKNISSGSTGNTTVPIVMDDFCYLYVASSVDYRGLYKIPVDIFKTYDVLTTYNITDGTFEKIKDNINGDYFNTQYPYYLHGAMDNDNNKLYITGFYNTIDYAVRCFSFDDKEFDNNTLIIRQGLSNGGSVKTQLFNTPLQSGRLIYPLYNAIHYTTENGANNSLPLYYGTGTEWVKFKN